MKKFTITIATILSGYMLYASNITFSSLQTKCINIEQVMLEFDVPVEEQVLFYLVEQSADGVIWNPVDTLWATGVWGASAHYESLLPVRPSEQAYFRVSIFSYDYLILYQDIVSASCQADIDDQKFCMMSMDGSQVLKIWCSTERDAQITIMDVNGLMVFQSHYHIKKGLNEIVIETSKPLEKMIVVSVSSPLLTNFKKIFINK